MKNKTVGEWLREYWNTFWLLFGALAMVVVITVEGWKIDGFWRPVNAAGFCLLLIWAGYRTGRKVEKKKREKHD